MTFQTALDNLCAKYERYGFSREELSKQLQGGVMEYGFSVNVAYNGIRMILANLTGEHELFTIEDVMEITGESREELTERIEQYREELTVAGKNPDDYFKPVEPMKFYFPGGISDIIS